MGRLRRLGRWRMRTPVIGRYFWVLSAPSFSRSEPSLEVDLLWSRLVARRGRSRAVSVDLTNAQLRAMVLFLDKRGHVIHRRELSKATEIQSANTLDVFIMRLRAKLRRIGVYIETSKQLGYILP